MHAGSHRERLIVTAETKGQLDDQRELGGSLQARRGHTCAEGLRTEHGE